MSCGQTARSRWKDILCRGAGARAGRSARRGGGAVSRCAVAAVALLAAIVIVPLAAPATAFANGPGAGLSPAPEFILPDESTTVGGEVLLWARDSANDTDVVSTTFSYNDGQDDHYIGTDNDSTVAVDGGRGDLPGQDSELGWSYNWNTQGVPEGPIVVKAQMTDLQHNTTIVQRTVNVRACTIDTEIISMNLTGMTGTGKFQVLTEDTTVTARVSHQPSTVTWEIFRADTYYKKGVTPKNQHDFGKGEGSAGQNIGDVYCVPTAIASCLDWWASNGHPKVKPQANQKDFVEAIANAIGTDDGGTAFDDYVAGIKKWLKDNGDELEASVIFNPTFYDYKEQLELRKEDVLVRIKGHVMTANSVSNLSVLPGFHRVDIMDPHTGKVFNTLMTDDGSIYYPPRKKWEKVTWIITISEKKKKPGTHIKTDTAPTLTPEYPIPVPLLDDGAYFVQVTAEDTQGGVAYDSSMFFINNNPPQPPAIASPANGAWVHSNNQVVYSFFDVFFDVFPLEHELEVNRSPAFPFPQSFYGSPVPSGMSLAELGGNLSDGRYYWRMRTIDIFGGESTWTASRYFTLDSSRPAVFDVYAKPTTFYPRRGQRTNYYYCLFDELSDRFRTTQYVYDSAGRLVRTTSRTDVAPPGVKKKFAFPWNGRNQSGAIVKPGRYKVRIIVTDRAGNRTIGPTLWVTVRS